MSIVAPQEWVDETFGDTIRYCPNCGLIKTIGADCACVPGTDLMLELGAGMKRHPLVEKTPEPGSIRLYENEDRRDSYYAYYEPERIGDD